MKTNKIYTAILTFCLVLFSVAGSIANPDADHKDSLSGKLTNNTATTGNNTAVDYPASGLDLNDFSYLRFDVNEYTPETSAITELPSAEPLEYLRFDVNKYLDADGSLFFELPTDDFSRLRFDANKYFSAGAAIGELPETE